LDVGEFIAAAKLMQVPHPPIPLFLFGARIAMMIPFAADQQCVLMPFRRC